jgi:peptidoglycan/xylan/chitin deacetylase (PgdA/CDA1 family)
MHFPIRRSIRALLRLVPWGLYRPMFPKPLVGLFYHSVSDERLPHQVHTYPSEPVARFSTALHYIQKHFNFVSYQQVEDFCLHGGTLPPRALHLSFDDGFAECFDVVRPILLEHGIPATFFVVADWLDDRTMFYRHKQSLCVEQMNQLPPSERAAALAAINREFGVSLADAGSFADWAGELPRSEDRTITRVADLIGLDLDAYLAGRQLYLTSDQLIQMHSEGFTIGAHTRTHWKLADLDDAEQREAEVLDSARAVAALTGQARVPLAFPYTGKGIARSELAGLRQRHPVLGLFFDTQKIRGDVPFVVQRIWAEQARYRQFGWQSNLPALLRDAYAAEAWRLISRFFTAGGRNQD